MPRPATDLPKTQTSIQRFWLLLFALVLLGGCSTVYYKTMEKFGYEKRDILVDRVEDARDSQNDAKTALPMPLGISKTSPGLTTNSGKRKYTE